MAQVLTSVEKVRRLLFPESIAIVGASPRRGGWAEAIYQNLRRFGYPGPIYLINPRYDMIWDVPCYPDLTRLPGKPDHLVVLVPSQSVEQVLLEGAKAGARSATVFAGGYGEGDNEQGKGMRQRLEQIIHKTNLAVSGPNCLGNTCAYSRLVTITDRRLREVEPGPVAILGQSGGIVAAINRSLAERGVRAGYMITTGNEAGLTSADYIEFFAQDPQTKVIVCFIESVGDAERFLAACRQAKATGKPIVAIKIGGSEESRTAAIAHTGALAGSLHAFDVIAGEAGVIRVDTLDEVVETVEYLVHAGLPAGNRIGVITFSGGLKELLLEAAERLRIHYPKLTAETERKLRELLPVGTSVGNPLDSGWGGLSSQETYLTCVDLLLSDPNIDMLLLQEELPRTEATKSKEDNIRKVNERITQGGCKPIAFFSMISHHLTEYSRVFRHEVPHLPFQQEVEKTLHVAKRVGNYAETIRLMEGQEKVSMASGPSSGRQLVNRLLEQKAGSGNESGNDELVVLNEVESKLILQQYGLPILEEKTAHTIEEALEACRSVGYPVVLKGVSSAISHKTDAGIVEVNLQNDTEVKSAFAKITKNSIAYSGSGLEEVLIAPYIPKGVEVVVGVQRDPEMGPIVMFGNGGVWLELYKDVAFGSTSLSDSQAGKIIAQTKVNRLLSGYRGDAPRDKEAVVRALVQISRMAEDLRDVLELVDINPLTVLEKGKGAFVLDGLIVLRRS